MTMDATPPPAAWHPDPSGMHQLRYWDGMQWTQHVSDNGVQTSDPIRSAEEIAKSAARAKKESERSAEKAAKEAEKSAKEVERATARDAAKQAREEKASATAARRADEKAQVMANPLGSFGGALLRGGLLTYQMKKIDMTEATAEATLSAPSQRTTATRMGAGLLIAGPVGLVAGALARKDSSKCYVTITTPNGMIVVEGRAKDYPSAVTFADGINRSRR